jgi:hypothetical protein
MLLRNHFLVAVWHLLRQQITSEHVHLIALPTVLLLLLLTASTLYFLVIYVEFLNQTSLHQAPIAIQG